MRPDATTAARGTHLASLQPSLLDRLAGAIAYFGGFGLLAVGMIRVLLRPRGEAPPLAASCGRCIDRLVWPGFVLVTCLQMSLGAFLSMQAFFGATFRDGTGAVVGLGMLRNLGGLVSGWVLAGLTASLFIPELRHSHAGLDDDPLSVPDREATRGARADDRIAPEPARLALVRFLAGVLAGPVLALWGALVGIGFGMMVAHSLLGVVPGVYLGKLLEMVRVYDILSLALKGAGFGGLAALAACHEGLRPGSQTSGAALAGAMFRAVVLTLFGMSVLNGSWFTLSYMSGAPQGPFVAP